MILTEVSYGKQMEYTIDRLSDTFQITGRQSDFRPNHRWVMCNYPLLLLLLLLLREFRKLVMISKNVKNTHNLIR